MDSSEFVPITNRPETIIGSAVAIQVLAISSVIFRLYARYRIEQGLGLDDLFVTLSCISTLIGTVFVSFQPNAGLGKHWAGIDLNQLTSYLYYTYASTCTYAMSTTLIKISILLQYIRMAGPGHPIYRWICIGMIGLVFSWGMVCFFTTVFACIPIASYWNVLSPGRCIMFGSRDLHEKFAAFIAQASSNMAFDIIIFLLPLPFLRSLELSKKSRVGLVCLFLIGSIVVSISVVRVASMVENRLGLFEPELDPTWYTPLTVISTCLEVNMAVLCASIPIFWPVLKNFRILKILVTKEVILKSELRMKTSRPESLCDNGDEMQLMWHGRDIPLTHARTHIQGLTEGG